jgi:hypothetical protein
MGNGDFGKSISEKFRRQIYKTGSFKFPILPFSWGIGLLKSLIS